jgi:hypothetical protein
MVSGYGQSINEAIANLKAEQQLAADAITALEVLTGKGPRKTQKARGISKREDATDAKAIRRALGLQGNKPPESWIKIRSKLLNGVTKTAGAPRRGRPLGSKNKPKVEASS